MTSVELSLDQHRLLESLGLDLMVLSVSIGLLSILLNKNTSQNRVPFAKPAMLLAMLLGVALLLLTILVPPHRAALPAPPVRPAVPALPAVSTPVATPIPVAAPAPEPPPPALPAQPPISEQELPLKVSATTSAPPPPKRPSAEVKPPLATVSPNPHPKPITNQKVPNEPEVKPETAKESHKANIFSARCSRLLEKVGSGEPMSNAEQQEMVTKCQ